MKKFLKFVHDDVVYCKYYEVIYILFHTGMRISEFCGLTMKDVDLTNNIINIDHQLQRTSDMRYIIDSTKTSAGTRKLPITQDVANMFRAIIEDREAPKYEKIIDGYSGFLFVDKNGNPLVAMHWQHRLNHMVKRYNDIYRVQMADLRAVVVEINFKYDDLKIDICKTYEYDSDVEDLRLHPSEYSVQEAILSMFQKGAYEKYSEILERQKKEALEIKLS